MVDIKRGKCGVAAWMKGMEMTGPTGSAAGCHVSGIELIASDTVLALEFRDGTKPLPLLPSSLVVCSRCLA